jgi:hypothetical protein
LETMSDVSNLGSLTLLNMTNCEKVVDIPGIECLKSLKRLYMSNCKACSLKVKRRLSKVLYLVPICASFRVTRFCLLLFSFFLFHYYSRFA